MNTYSVLFHSEASFTVEVEAENEEDAVAFCEYGLHHDNVDENSIHCMDIYGGCEGVSLR